MKYAALITSTVWVDGDERSKNHPGHGYPGHHEERLRIREFKSKSEMLEYVQEQETSKYGKDNYRLIEYSELVVNKEVSIKVA